MALILLTNRDPLACLDSTGGGGPPDPLLGGGLLTLFL